MQKPAAGVFRQRALKKDVRCFKHMAVRYAAAIVFDSSHGLASFIMIPGRKKNMQRENLEIIMVEQNFYIFLLTNSEKCVCLY
jgi:hypothetical protein